MCLTPGPIPLPLHHLDWEGSHLLRVIGWRRLGLEKLAIGLETESLDRQMGDCLAAERAIAQQDFRVDPRS